MRCHLTDSSQPASTQQYQMQISPHRTPFLKTAQPLRPHKLWSFELQVNPLVCIFYLSKIRFAFQYLFNVQNLMMNIYIAEEIFFWSQSFLSKCHDVKCWNSRISFPEACTHRTGEGGRKERGGKIWAVEWSAKNPFFFSSWLAALGNQRHFRLLPTPEMLSLSHFLLSFSLKWF